MKKKLFACALLLMQFLLLKSQVVITPQVPPAGALLKSQLWNIIVISANDNSNATLSLTLGDAATNEQVLSGFATGIRLNKGSNQLNLANLPGITYDYISPDFSDRSPEGFLLAGNYKACYALSLNADKNVINECIPLMVEAVSPPMLNTPFNKEVLQTRTPQFTWIQPMPLQIFKTLNYDFKLVEVGEAQNPADALEQNMPVYNSTQTEPYLNYSAAADMLDTGKTYAWQIIAKSGDTYAAKSDVWTFTIQQPPPVKINTVLSSALKLKRTLDGSTGTAVGTLKLQYINEAEDTAASFRIINISDKNLSVVKFGATALTRGMNEMEIPFTAADDMQSGKTYLFELTNSRQEKWSVKFIYLKNN